jgi:hypothetical protein
VNFFGSVHVYMISTIKKDYEIVQKIGGWGVGG